MCAGAAAFGATAVASAFTAAFAFVTFGVNWAVCFGVYGAYCADALELLLAGSLPAA